MSAARQCFEIVSEVVNEKISAPDLSATGIVVSRKASMMAVCHSWFFAGLPASGDDRFEEIDRDRSLMMSLNEQLKEL